MNKCIIAACHNVQSPGSSAPFCDRHEELWKVSPEGLRARQVYQTTIADFVIRLNAEEAHRTAPHTGRKAN